ASTRFLVALDDPLRAIENLIVHHGFDFLEATRAVAKSCASMASCVSMPGALVLRAEESGMKPVAIADAIARHFELCVSEPDIGGIVTTLADLCLWPVREEGVAWRRSLDERQGEIVDGAIRPYVSCFEGGDLGMITWERELFFINEEQDEKQRQIASR